MIKYRLKKGKIMSMLKQRRWSQADLARSAGLPNNSLYSALNFGGKKHAHKIAKALGTGVSDILGVKEG